MNGYPQSHAADSNIGVVSAYYVIRWTTGADVASWSNHYEPQTGDQYRFLFYLGEFDFEDKPVLENPCTVSHNGKEIFRLDDPLLCPFVMQKAMKEPESIWITGVDPLSKQPVYQHLLDHHNSVKFKFHV